MPDLPKIHSAGFQQEIPIYMRRIITPSKQDAFWSAKNSFKAHSKKIILIAQLNLYLEETILHEIFKF